MAIRISGTTGIDMGNTPVSNIDVGALDYNAVNKDYVDSATVKLTGDQTIDDVKTFSSNIVGDITGNSATATKLATARTINGVSFDGTANIIVPVSDDSAVNLTQNQTIGGIKTFSSNIVGNITGNAATATKLQTARTINGVAFDGSTNITVSDSAAVKLTGNETIAGIKTFSSSIVGNITGNASLNLPLTGGTMTGAITAIRETKVAMGADSINLATGNLFTKTIVGATTLTISGALPNGNANSFILELTNGGTGIITWWSGMKWAGGTAPTLTTAGVDILGFYSHDGGTTWRGMLMAKDSK